MSLLENVTKGKIKKPHLVLIFGVDSVGKTSFGANAPKPIIIGPESGSANLDTTRLETKNYAELMQTIEDLRKDKHDYQTIVLDSLDWIEPQVWDAVCKAVNVDSIEKFGGGYGKGYLEANVYWNRVIAALRTLREERKMNVILIAHSQIKAFNDPALAAPYDRYILKLNEKASALWREFVDTVLFATFETFVKKEGNKHKGFGDGARVVFTERRPGFDAKNRFGLPFQLALSWDDYQRAVESSIKTPDKLRERITAMLSEIKDDELKKLVIDTVEKAGDNIAQLEAIENRLRIRLEQ